ncbi:MAG: hypothetical protein FJ276_17110 [Planctomycetes bacterium]|nr:hypothetical protein [Planctomycetota bacterium]
MVLSDRGDGDLWRLSRLRWLNSTIGLDDEVLAPFSPVEQEGSTISILGRSVRLAASGLIESITGTFSRNVDRIDAERRELLIAPMRFVVKPVAAAGARQEPAASRPGDAPAAAAFTFDAPEIVAKSSGAVAWKSVGRSGPMTLVCEAKLECDGYVNYRLTLGTTAAVDLDDLRLEIPFRRDAARLMMGLGRKGGHRPEAWPWKWDPAVSNNQFWLGDVNLGLSCKLKHAEERWDLFNTKETGGYRDWFDGTHGGCDITEQGSDCVLASAYTGPRRLEPGRELCFRFGLLITPVKTLDKDHWKWRYYHGNGTPPLEQITPTGANIINVHQGDALNPYINYPFVNEQKIREFVEQAHAAEMRVKLYYTIRELSNYTAEIWALRSLGDEVYVQGEGFRLADAFAEEKSDGGGANTGGSWLCEHLVTGYQPAWHTPLGGGRQDAAIATTGLSRWHNYYLEGLSWLIRKDGVDGLYLDGVGYDREIMKRVRKVMQRSRPGCLIDFHSGNHFHPVYGLNNCANLYIELFPFIDSLWFGEGFDYNEPPDYWLVEMAGIPYGLFGEMLHGGGNPWRGMLFGMTSRLGWSGDPRPIWKLWDEFGIDEARMIGYWDEQCPATAGCDQVLATAYVRPKQTLVALASWAAEPMQVQLQIDWKTLGLDPEKTSFYAPPIEGFQPQRVFRPGQAIPVPPGRGWLLLLDEQQREIPKPEDPLAGCKLIEREAFDGAALDAVWKNTQSSQPGTSIGLVEGRLQVAGAANVVAYVQRPLPAGVIAAACTIRMQTDAGASWGPGMALVWPDGRTLRVNLRAEGRFGVDDGRQQRLDGLLLMDQPTRVVIRLADERIVVTAIQAEYQQTLAVLPRSDFPGTPSAVRIGKMGPHAGSDDFNILGPAGVTTIDDLEIFGAIDE